MLIFDEFGNLTPAQPLESDLTELETVFVFNERRQLIFNDFQVFLSLLLDGYKGNFQIWVDGSFTTRKTLPKDIDIVILIDFQWYEDKNNENLIYLLKSIPTIDAYFVSVYPTEHPFFCRTQSDQAYWFNQFSKDRQRRRKGIILINF